MSCNYKTNEISKQEYIGTSLIKINDYFDVLNEDVCVLDAEIQKKLKVERQGQRFGFNTHVLNFSGNNVVASRSAFEQKTVMVPITGVTHLYSDDDWENRGGLRVTSVKSTEDTKSGLGEGDITITGYLPPPPRQIQTFFYYGPNAATDPTSNTFSNTDTIPQATYIESFVNDVLKHKGNRLNDICYVVFQKNGYNLIQRLAASSSSDGFGSKNYFHRGIKKTVSMTVAANKSFASYKQRDMYIEMLPRFIIYKLLYTPSATTPGILRFQLQYINGVPQIWEETSYVENTNLPSV